MTTATRSARTGDKPPKDAGCQFAPRCTACPWARCIKELPDSQRNEFVKAYRVVVRHLALVEREGTVG
jgi:hypothetical protein